MPVEARLELSAVVGLDDEDSERQPPENLVYKTDGRC
jgi:hypothetical protein